MQLKAVIDYSTCAALGLQWVTSFFFFFTQTEQRNEFVLQFGNLDQIRILFSFIDSFCHMLSCSGSVISFSTLAQAGYQ